MAMPKKVEIVGVRHHSPRIRNAGLGKRFTHAATGSLEMQVVGDFDFGDKFFGLGASGRELSMKRDFGIDRG